MGNIYFVKSGDEIKIGFSTRAPQARLSEVSAETGRELTILGVARGDMSLETALHRHLRSYRLHGEWFSDCAAVREAMTVAIDNGETAFASSPLEYPELIAAIKLVAAPFSMDDSVKQSLERAAARIGLSYWRTFDIYYGKARRVLVPEAIQIRDALIRATT